MEARVRVLASGSSGNAVFAALGDTTLLIDVGIELRHLARGLAACGAGVDDLTAVLLSHNHSDHVRGLAALREAAPDVPVYATRGTARSVARNDGPAVSHPTLLGGASLNIGSVRVTPFEVGHDAAEPVGFRLDCGDFALGVATDLGQVSPTVIAALSGCRVVILEANHCEDMLRRGPYPRFLKRRIAGTRGHLSNRQAAALLAALPGPPPETVILAHLSRQNNHPERATATVGAAFAGQPGVSVMAADRKAPGPVLRYPIEQRPLPPLGLTSEPQQLSMFD